MATVLVNTTAGKTMIQKRAVIREITDSIEKHFKLPRQVIRVYVNEVPRTNVADGGLIFADRDKKTASSSSRNGRTNSRAGAARRRTQRKR